jgi:hypothetical protein
LLQQQQYPIGSTNPNNLAHNHPSLSPSFNAPSTTNSNSSPTCLNSKTSADFFGGNPFDIQQQLKQQLNHQSKSLNTSATNQSTSINRPQISPSNSKPASDFPVSSLNKVLFSRIRFVFFKETIFDCLVRE